MSRRATGLTRPKPLPVNLSADEKELICRESYQFQKSQAQLLREAYFKKDFSSRLNNLRSLQAGLSNEEIYGTK